jgi:hypothetical protein
VWRTGGRQAVAADVPCCGLPGGKDAFSRPPQDLLHPKPRRPRQPLGTKEAMLPWLLRFYDVTARSGHMAAPGTACVRRPGMDYQHTPRPRRWSVADIAAALRHRTHARSLWLTESTRTPSWRPQ